MIPTEPWIQRSPSSSQSPVERYANKQNKRQSRFSFSGLQRTTNRFINKGNNLFSRSSSECNETITNNSNVYIISGEVNNNIYKNNNYNGIVNLGMENLCPKYVLKIILFDLLITSRDSRVDLKKHSIDI